MTTVADPRRWPALVVIAVSQLMAVLDASIVNIALPQAQAALHISDADRQRVITAYTLAFWGLLLGGRVADFIGRKRRFLIGLAGFAAASVLGGEALLDTVTLYWLTRTAASSARMYWESFAVAKEGSDRQISVPTGAAISPADMMRPSERWVRRRYPDLRHYAELERGGHFPAAEQLDRFVEELRAFARTL